MPYCEPRNIERQIEADNLCSQFVRSFKEHFLDEFVAGNEAYLFSILARAFGRFGRLKHGNFVRRQCIRFIKQPAFRQSPLMAQLVGAEFQPLVRCRGGFAVKN